MTTEPGQQLTIEVEWDGDRRFRGGRPDAPFLLLDADRALAPGPVDALVISVVACASVDLVEILQKQRTPLTALQTKVHVTRATTIPRRLTRLHIVYSVATHAPLHHVERAVELSLTKYCSVTASLAPDVEISWEVQQDAGA